jgi:hypothetical protein
MVSPRAQPESASLGKWIIRLPPVCWSSGEDRRFDPCKTRSTCFARQNCCSGGRPWAALGVALKSQQATPEREACIALPLVLRLALHLALFSCPRRLGCCCCCCCQGGPSGLSEPAASLACSRHSYLPAVAGGPRSRPGRGGRILFLQRPAAARGRARSLWTHLRARGWRGVRHAVGALECASTAVGGWPPATCGSGCWALARTPGQARRGAPAHQEHLWIAAVHKVAITNIGTARFWVALRRDTSRRGGHRTPTANRGPARRANPAFAAVMKL